MDKIRDRLDDQNLKYRSHALVYMLANNEISFNEYARQTSKLWKIIQDKRDRVNQILLWQNNQNSPEK